MVDRDFNEYSNGKKYNGLRYDEQLSKALIIFKILGDEKTLDVGCGTGISSEPFNDVIGIDPSEELLKYNKKTCFLASAEDLPFDDDSFVNVISITAIHNFDDIKLGLSEIKRVGKRFGFSLLKRSSKTNKILELIGDLFVVDEIIDQGTDLIIIASK